MFFIGKEPNGRSILISKVYLDLPRMQKSYREKAFVVIPLVMRICAYRMVSKEFRCQFQ